MGIMKHNSCMETSESTERANQDADNAELSQSGRGIESNAQGIKAGQEPIANIPEVPYPL